MSRFGSICFRRYFLSLGILLRLLRENFRNKKEIVENSTKGPPVSLQNLISESHYEGTPENLQKFNQYWRKFHKFLQNSLLSLVVRWRPTRFVSIWYWAGSSSEKWEHRFTALLLMESFFTFLRYFSTKVINWLLTICNACSKQTTANSSNSFAMIDIHQSENGVQFVNSRISKTKLREHFAV